MLSVGWIEMLAVAVVALIVVGPRDLPAMLRQVGKLVGSARRMSNEFRSELNKVTALDEITSIKKSVSEPFKNIRKDMTSEFNKIGAKGVEPTGALKQDNPETESVVDDIMAKAGLAREAMSKAAIAKRDAEAAAAASAMTIAKPTAKTKATAQKAGVKKPAAQKAVSKSASAKTPAAKAKPAPKSGVKKAAPPAATKAPSAPKTSAKKAVPAQTAKSPAVKASPRSIAKKTTKTTSGEA